MRDNVLFADRRDAGKKLADHLESLALPHVGVRVLALPRGGVPVAYEVARRLDAPLDVLVVRKLGVPGHGEYAMGALAAGGFRVLDDEVIRGMQVGGQDIQAVIDAESEELRRREQAYRHGLPPPDMAGMTVVLVDDGMATGSSLRAAVMAVRGQGPRALVAAVPVGSPQACAALRPLVDEMVCLATPEPFHAVGLWYADFPQTGDLEVETLLRRRRHDAGKPG